MFYVWNPGKRHVNYQLSAFESHVSIECVRSPAQNFYLILNEIATFMNI